MRARIVLCLLTLALAACLTGCSDLKSVIKDLPGEPMKGSTHVVSCSGRLQSWGQCISKAAKLCGDFKFTVLRSAGEPHEGPPQSAKRVRTMYVKCN